MWDQKNQDNDVFRRQNIPNSPGAIDSDQLFKRSSFFKNPRGTIVQDTSQVGNQDQDKSLERSEDLHSDMNPKSIERVEILRVDSPDIFAQFGVSRQALDHEDHSQSLGE